MITLTLWHVFLDITRIINDLFEKLSARYQHSYSSCTERSGYQVIDLNYHRSETIKFLSFFSSRGSSDWLEASCRSALPALWPSIENVSTPLNSMCNMNMNTIGSRDTCWKWCAEACKGLLCGPWVSGTWWHVFWGRWWWWRRRRRQRRRGREVRRVRVPSQANPLPSLMSSPWGMSFTTTSVWPADTTTRKCVTMTLLETPVVLRWT